MSEMEIKDKTGGYEMLQALYDFSATIAQTISFNKDDYFIFHPNNNIKRNWWNVINVNGKIGYIPSNYVAFVKVPRAKYIEFLNKGIEQLSREIYKEGGGSDKQLELMKELISRKQEVVEFKSPNNRERLTSSKSLPTPTSAISPEDTSSPYKSRKDHSPTPPMRLSSSDNKFPSINAKAPSLSPEKNLKMSQDHSNSIAPLSTYSLIQQVRSQTELSYEDARVAVGVVVEGLSEILPPATHHSLEAFLEVLQTEINPPTSILDDTYDARQLRKILAHLTAAKEDAQQRSWQLWDDECTIKQNITQLSSILSKADVAISRWVLKSNEFSDVLMLVDYYQMEERWSIRQLLIQTFAVMCSLDKVIISILLNSVLPMELAREMMSNVKNVSKLSKPAMLLSMVFSLGEPMPITHLEHLGVVFIKMVLSIIESEPDSETADSMLTLLLSYNLQFIPKSSTNITIEALNEVETAKHFTEKMMLLINREEDPLKKLKIHKSNSHHSVLKLLKDLFLNPTTAKLFYTNDVKVFIDIIVRQLTDLGPNNPKRTDYLELCKYVMFSCEPIAFEHRLEELRTRFSYILTEEVPPVEEDKRIVREISSGLPQYFGELGEAQQAAN